MADYQNDYYAEVDNLFATIKEGPFTGKDTAAVEQEQPDAVQPVGWVENADSSDGEPTVRIDADGIEVLDGKITVKHTDGTDFINSPSADVVIDADGITITNGALTVENASGTVIIDGSSNMFKIQASGSTSLTVPASAGGAFREDVTTVTLTGLGAHSTIPAFLAYISSSLSATDYRLIGATGTWLVANAGWVANSSGGAVNRATVATMTDVIVGCSLDGSSFPKITLASYSVYSISVTFYAYYHVLKEAAL